MFRRPKKQIRPRVVIMDGEEGDDSDMDYAETSIADKSALSPPLSVIKEVKAPKKATLLSFDEENEEEEVFKVKKSSVSRRLIKEKKRKETNNSKKTENLKPTKPSTMAESSQEGEAESILKVTNFVRILTGREAEAIDMESGSEEEDETHMRFKPRPAADAVSEVLRRTLEKEQIPDANLIHEIRKKRQMARDTGGVGAAPFIPVDDSIKFKPSKSRLIREDENDQSEDDDEKRIDFTIDSTKADKERRREAFDAAQDRGHDHHSESDPDHDAHDEWEHQQIRKGVSQAQLQLAAQQSEFFPTGIESNGDFYNSHDSKPMISSSSSRPLSSRIEEVMGGKTLRNVDSIIRNLNDRLESLRITKESHEGELSRLRTEADLVLTESADCVQAKIKLSARLRLYQGIHCYVHDLIDCLRCKVPEIQELEDRTLGLLQAHAEFLMKRRRQDRDDQYEECSSTLRPPSSHPTQGDIEEREKRGAERKGRRTRRRKEREDSNVTSHAEGLSTDDEELESDTIRFRNMRDAIFESASRIFSDVNEDYCEIDRILDKFLEWRTEDGDAYRDSYVPLCIPKVLSPILRIQLLYFDPLQDELDLFRTSWMKTLLYFGFSPGETRESLIWDPDIKLVPGVCEKVVIPWIEKVITAEYDPVSTKQTKRFIHLVTKLLSDYTININSKQVHSLLKSILTKLEEATDKDVFIPMFDTSALMKSSEVNVFASRQFYSSVKILDNICSWTGLLSEKHLQTLALDKLLARYIVSSVRLSIDLQEAVKRAQAIVNVLPRVWLTETEPPHGIRHLIRALLVLVQERTDFSLPENKSQIEPMAAVLRILGAVNEAKIVTLKYA